MHPLETAFKPIDLQKEDDITQLPQPSIIKIESDILCPLDKTEQNKCTYSLTDKTRTAEFPCYEIAIIDPHLKPGSMTPFEENCAHCRVRCISVLTLYKEGGLSIEDLIQKETEELLIRVEEQDKANSKMHQVKVKVLTSIPIWLRRVMYYIFGY